MYEKRLCTHGQIARYDPTKTLTLRKRFESELSRRFRKLRGAIRRIVDHEDGFGLRIKHRFAFPRSQDKIAAFMQWLAQQEYLNILQVSPGTSLESAAERAWTTTYVRAAYGRGIASAGAELRRNGATVDQRYIDSAFFRPIHADRAGLIYTRTFTGLAGITDAMDVQISRTLAQGIIEGQAPRVIASQLNEKVDMALTRARMLARTEVIAAHAEATLNTYREAGLEGVSVQAEFTTAGDDSVCPECEALEGRIFDINDASGIIPVHPNCRCAFLPVIPNGRAIELR